MNVSPPPPFPSKSRLPAIKVKYLLLAWLGILITSWVLYMQYASYSELCRGHVCQMVIVSNFEFCFMFLIPSDKI